MRTVFRVRKRTKPRKNIIFLVTLKTVRTVFKVTKKMMFFRGFVRFRTLKTVRTVCNRLRRSEIAPDAPQTYLNPVFESCVLKNRYPKTLPGHKI